ncbi:MAG: hypothetical protein Q8K79_00430 [Solirubrobacteraceae bacterium]|nr:hypothetical protein [Solirubrobacteraceae bacterium]
MPRRPTTGAVLSAVIGLTLAACGGEEDVSRDVQRALPTVQGTLLAQLCDPLDRALRQPMS